MPLDQVYTMQYEQLLQEPERTIAKLETFLGNPLDDSTRTALFEEIHQSPMRSNYGKWRKAMSKREQRNFEAVGGEWLRRLGYETVINDPQVGWIDRTASAVREFLAKTKLTFLSVGRKYPLD